MEYNNTIREWRTIYQTIDKRIGQKSAWWPFHETQVPEQYQDYHNNPVFVKDESRIDVRNTQIIPKSRTIIDCSNTETPGMAPNDNVSEEEKSVKYINIIDIIRIIVTNGIMWMIAADAQNAFNRCPIQNSYIRLFAIRLGQFIIFWTALVFGGATSCAIYTRFASYLAWMIVYLWPDFFVLTTIVLANYLDDFFAGHITLEGAWQQYDLLKYAFEKFGVPTQEKKMTPPTQRLKYIGFTIDTKQQQLEIPMDKMIKLRIRAQEILNKWEKRQTTTVHEIASFVGLARYATYVFYYIIPYMRRLEGAVANKQPTDRIKGNKEMEKDIWMIMETIEDPTNNKISFKWLLYPKDKGDIVIETDASTGTGIGGIEMYPEGRHYGIEYKDIENWPINNKPDIAFLELAAIYVMIKARAPTYSGKAILIRCDNEGVCAIVRKKAACLERKDLQQLIRKICQQALQYKFYFWIKWISTEDNIRADGLSRGKTDALETSQFNTKPINDIAKAITKEAIEIYMEARKRMHRHSKMTKKCVCENRKLCDDQPLYNKWINS